MLRASLMIFMLAWVVVALQIHDDKHGFGSGYLGYGNNVRLNEVGGLGIASAGASEDSIELMVGPATTAAQHCTAQHITMLCMAVLQQHSTRSALAIRQNWSLRQFPARLQQRQQLAEVAQQPWSV